jgi:hypothetical protein
MRDAIDRQLVDEEDEEEEQQLKTPSVTPTNFVDVLCEIGTAKKRAKDMPGAKEALTEALERSSKVQYNKGECTGS